MGITSFWISLAVDWIIADMLAIRQSALGHVRYVLKDGLKWLPLYGWYFSQVMPLCKCFNVRFVLCCHNVALFISAWGDLRETKCQV